MPAAYTDLAEANAAVDRLEAELAATAEAGRQVQKTAEALRTENQTLMGQLAARQAPADTAPVADPAAQFRAARAAARTAVA